jgi:hypothetical protein
LLTHRTEHGVADANLLAAVQHDGAGDLLPVDERPVARAHVGQLDPPVGQRLQGHMAPRGLRVAKNEVRVALAPDDELVALDVGRAA